MSNNTETTAFQIFLGVATTRYPITSTETPVDEELVEVQAITKNDIVAAVIIFLVGICGITGNIVAIRIIKRVPSLHNCFGYLLLLHAIAEAVVLFIFIFWAAPITVFGKDVSYSLLGIKVGHAILVFYFITLYCQLMKALNRLTAIAMPIFYRTSFRNENIKYVFGIIIGTSLCHGIVYFFDGCNFYFNGDTYVWTFDSTPCGNVISYYIDFIYGSSLMIFIIFIDFCTFVFIQKGSKLINKGNMKSRKEIQFFIQTCSTSLLYSLMLLSFHLVWRFTSDIWIVFVSTTFAWELCHALDGILMILFNSKLRSNSTAASLVTHYSKASKVSSIPTRNDPATKTIFTKNVTSMEKLMESSISTTITPEDEKPLSDYYIAASIMFTVGICGLIANFVAIRIIWRSKSLHNCFGYLLLLHVSAEALVLCAFVFWSVPVTLFNRSLSKSTLGFKVGHVAVVFYYITIYVQLFKSMNRFCAICSPVKYRRWFSNENGKFVLLAVVFCGVLQGMAYFIPGCDFYYDTRTFTWDYDQTPCYEIISFYVDFLTSCFIIGITMFTDGCTLCLIMKKNFFKDNSNKEVKFFFQAFSSSMVFTVMLVIIRVFAPLSTNSWYMFGTLTFNWEMCHFIDSVLVIAFNFQSQNKTEVSTVSSKKELNNKASSRVA